MALDNARGAPALYLRQATAGSFVPACDAHNQMIKYSGHIYALLFKYNFGK
jgi:hypothetical protein